MIRFAGTLAFCVVLGFSVRHSSADGVVADLHEPNGGRSIAVDRGESFVLYLDLVGDDPYFQFQSFAVWVDLDLPGLVLDSYDFPSPVLTVGGPDDGSTSPGVLGTEMEFTNLTDHGGETVSYGTLATMDLTVPGDFPLGKVGITTMPDFFTLDLDIEWWGKPGPPFSLIVVPEPMTLGMLGVGGLVVLRRRRAA